MIAFVTTVFAVFFGAIWGTTSVHAAEFVVKEIVWCNGPYQGSDGAACPTFSAWNGVELKHLTTITLPLKRGETSLAFASSKAQIWKQDVSQCKSQPGDTTGCSFNVRSNDPDKISMSYVQRHFQDTLRLTLILRQGNELWINGTDNSILAFSLERLND